METKFEMFGKIKTKKHNPFFFCQQEKKKIVVMILSTNFQFLS